MPVSRVAVLNHDTGRRRKRIERIAGRSAAHLLEPWPLRERAPES